MAKIIQLVIEVEVPQRMSLKETKKLVAGVIKAGEEVISYSYFENGDAESKVITEKLSAIEIIDCKVV